MGGSSPARSAIGLDIGSNTFSCVELAIKDGRLEVIDDVSRVVRLGERLAAGGRLSPEAVERGLDALRDLAERFSFGRKPLRAVGTAALRLARDPETFTGPARAILGTEVEIVDGRTEALITRGGATLGLPGDGPWIVVDTGGGSTEVCIDTSTGPEAFSLPLGVIDLTATHLRSDPPLAGEIQTMRESIRRAIAAKLPRHAAGEILAVAGTATTLARLDAGLGRFSRDAIHGREMTRERLADWARRMAGVPVSARVRGFGISRGRADVFPAGLAVIEEIVDFFGKDRFVVSANGLRVGAALSLLREEA